MTLPQLPTLKELNSDFPRGTKAKAKRLVKELLADNDIEYTWVLRVLGEQPCADLHNQHVYIPELFNVMDFLTCLHEIGHIMTWDGETTTSPVLEYQAYYYAIEAAEKAGFDTTQYQAYGKHRVFLELLDFRDDEGYSWDELEEETQAACQWVGITQDMWNQDGEITAQNFCIKSLTSMYL